MIVKSSLTSTLGSNKFESLSKWVSEKLQKKKDKKKSSSSENPTIKISKEEISPSIPEAFYMEDANYLTGQPINFQTALDPHVNPNNLSGMLREWIWVKTKFSICVLGEKGVGKSFLVNALLEATFQDLVQSSPNSSLKSTNNLEDDFFMIDVAPKKQLKKKISPPPSPQSHSNHSSSSNVSMPSQTSSANSSAPTSASSSASSLFSEFLEDEDFASMVNWASESDAKRNIEHYLKLGKFNTNMSDRYSYLLPQGPFAWIYARNYVLSYAKVPGK